MSKTSASNWCSFEWYCIQNMSLSCPGIWLKWQLTVQFQVCLLLRAHCYESHVHNNFIIKDETGIVGLLSTFLIVNEFTVCASVGRGKKPHTYIHKVGAQESLSRTFTYLLILYQNSLLNFGYGFLRLFWECLYDRARLPISCGLVELVRKWHHYESFRLCVQDP